ncbi:MAG: hypothetical protein ACI9DJ_003457, partial [Algoriphagus sp.]
MRIKFIEKFSKIIIIYSKKVLSKITNTRGFGVLG